MNKRIESNNSKHVSEETQLRSTFARAASTSSLRIHIKAPKQLFHTDNIKPFHAKNKRVPKIYHKKLNCGAQWLEHQTHQQLQEMKKHQEDHGVKVSQKEHGVKVFQKEHGVNVRKKEHGVQVCQEEHGCNFLKKMT